MSVLSGLIVQALRGCCGARGCCGGQGSETRAAPRTALLQAPHRTAQNTHHLPTRALPTHKTAAHHTPQQRAKAHLLPGVVRGAVRRKLAPPLLGVDLHAPQRQVAALQQDGLAARHVLRQRVAQRVRRVGRHDQRRVAGGGEADCQRGRQARLADAAFTGDHDVLAASAGRELGERRLGGRGGRRRRVGRGGRQHARRGAAARGAGAHGGHGRGAAQGPCSCGRGAALDELFS